jgi:hypothetical protein
LGIVRPAVRCNIYLLKDGTAGLKLSGLGLRLFDWLIGGASCKHDGRQTK